MLIASPPRGNRLQIRPVSVHRTVTHVWLAKRTKRFCCSTHRSLEIGGLSVQPEQLETEPRTLQQRRCQGIHERLNDVLFALSKGHEAGSSTAQLGPKRRFRKGPANFRGQPRYV